MGAYSTVTILGLVFELGRLWFSLDRMGFVSSFRTVCLVSLDGLGIIISLYEAVRFQFLRMEYLTFLFIFLIEGNSISEIRG